jgi:hypothetical protein
MSQQYQHMPASGMKQRHQADHAQLENQPPALHLLQVNQGPAGNDGCDRRRRRDHDKQIPAHHPQAQKLRPGAHVALPGMQQRHVHQGGAPYHQCRDMQGFDPCHPFIPRRDKAQDRTGGGIGRERCKES